MAVGSTLHPPKMVWKQWCEVRNTNWRVWAQINHSSYSLNASLTLIHGAVHTSEIWTGGDQGEKNIPDEKWRTWKTSLHRMCQRPISKVKDFARQDRSCQGCHIVRGFAMPFTMDAWKKTQSWDASCSHSKVPKAASASMREVPKIIGILLLGGGFIFFNVHPYLGSDPISHVD